MNGGGDGLVPGCPTFGPPTIGDEAVPAPAFCAPLIGPADTDSHVAPRSAAESERSGGCGAYLRQVILMLAKCSSCGNSTFAHPASTLSIAGVVASGVIVSAVAFVVPAGRCSRNRRWI